METKTPFFSIKVTNCSNCPYRAYAAYGERTNHVWYCGYKLELLLAPAIQRHKENIDGLTTCPLLGETVTFR